LQVLVGFSIADAPGPDSRTNSPTLDGAATSPETPADRGPGGSHQPGTHGDHARVSVRRPLTRLGGDKTSKLAGKPAWRASDSSSLERATGAAWPLVVASKLLQKSAEPEAGPLGHRADACSEVC